MKDSRPARAKPNEKHQIKRSMIVIFGICASIVGTAPAAGMPVQVIEANCSLDVEFPMSRIKWARPYGPGAECW